MGVNEAVCHLSEVLFECRCFPLIMLATLASQLLWDLGEFIVG